MPTISVTKEEYEAIMFYRDETMDKAEKYFSSPIAKIIHNRPKIYAMSLKSMN